MIEEVEKATFAMQEEVKEAEATVDACYRRRARRAGLGELLPAGRHMTEEELDYLSEQLGDGIGARARRRKEIEQMTLAEMEAELGGGPGEDQEEEERGGGVAAPDADAVPVHLGAPSGGIHRIRLLQSEQHRGGVLATGAGRVCQYG